MFKVYLVDDEALIIEELRYLISWEDYGFHVIGSSTDPVKAEKEILELHPDLVFCDVSMDKMNDFTLFEHVRKQRKIKFCFLSAFDTFEYAQEAVRLGAIRYLKKPIRTKDLISLLTEVKENEKETFNAKVFDSIVNHAFIENDEVLEHLFKENPMIPQHEKERIVVFIKEEKWDEKCMQSLCQYSISLYDDEKMRIFLCAKVNLERLNQYAIENHCSIGVSEEFLDYRKIALHLRLARIAAKQKFISGKDECTIYSMNESVNQVIQEIDKTKNAYELLAALQTLPSLIEQYQIKVYDLQKIYRVIVFNMTKFGVVGYDDNLLDISVLDYYSSFEDMMQDILSNFQEREENDGTSAIISDVIQELEDHIDQKLTLSYFAEKYNYNPSYFSQLFKKVCGCSFAEYFISLKMKRAKNLIANTDLSLTLIASQIGYDDYYHFSKMFKKYTDYSPTKYREMHLK